MNGIASIVVALCLTSTAADSLAPQQQQITSVGHVAFSIPASFEYEDDHGTLVAWPHGIDGIVLRVSVNSLLLDGKPVPGAGVAIVTKQAAKEHLTLERTGDAVWYHTEEPPEAGAPPGSAMHFWNVGFGGHGLVVSCYIDGRVRNQPQAVAVMTQVVELIASLREASRA